MSSFTTGRSSPRRPFPNHELLQQSIEHRSALGLGRAKTHVPNQDISKAEIRRNLTNRQELQGHRYYHAPLRLTSSVTTSSANPCSNFVWSKGEVDKKMNEKHKSVIRRDYNESSLSKESRDQYEIKEHIASIHRQDEQKYMRLNNSRHTMEILQGQFSDITPKDGNNVTNDMHEKSLDIVPAIGSVIKKSFNRLGGRNTAEVEAEMKAVNLVKEAEKEKKLLESKMATHTRLFQSDATAYFGKESILERAKVGERRPRNFERKQTALYAKHLKSSIGNW